MKWWVGIITILCALIAVALFVNQLDLPVSPPGDDPLLSPLPRPQPGV
jgi:hypothetical protein